MLLLQQMIVLFTYMILGFYGSRKGVLDARSGKTLSWIVVEVANPALMINSAVNGESRIADSELLTAAVIAVVMYAVLILLAQIIPVIFRVPKQEIGTYKLMTMFNNIGFMGFPVIAAAFGSGALLYASVFSLMFNLVAYTYGILLVDPKAAKEGFHWKNLLNMGVISCVIAVVLYLSELPVPDFFKTVVSGLGGVTGPLSMMVIGISLSFMDLKDLFLDVKLLVYAAVKLLLIPVVGTLIIGHIIDNELLVAVCMVMLATPVASMVAMLSQQYDHNVELASKGVALTTVLSVVTIPLVSAIVL